MRSHDFIKMKKSLGLIIRRHRENTGLSQEALADAIGLHRTYLGAIERGERNPSLKNLARISAALPVTLSELFKELETDLASKKSRKEKP